MSTKKSKSQDPDDPTFIRARAYTVITTIDGCTQRLEKQMNAASASWKDQLSEATKAYREILRDEDNQKASTKRRAGFYDQLVKLLAERDQLAEAKAEDMKARKAKIAQLTEAAFICFSTHVATVGPRWTAAVTAALKREGWTRTDLARILGVARQYVTKILDGEKPTLPVETYRAICVALDLDPNEYATIQESTPPWESSK